MIQRFLVYIQDKNALYFISFCISCTRLATTGVSQKYFSIFCLSSSTTGIVKRIPPLLFIQTLSTGFPNRKRPIVLIVHEFGSLCGKLVAVQSILVSSPSTSTMFYPIVCLCHYTMNKFHNNLTFLKVLLLIVCSQFSASFVVSHAFYSIC